MDEDDDDLGFVEEAAIKYMPRMTAEQYCEWEGRQEGRKILDLKYQVADNFCSWFFNLGL